VVILLVWIALIIKGGKRGRVAAVLLIPVLTLTDQLSASVYKPLIARIRPCHTLETVRLLVNCGGRFAFPSSHATNMAGFAMLFSLIYRKWFVCFWIITVLIGYSRIYVGVHYPGDVIYGLLLGAFVGLFVYAVYLFVAAKMQVFRYF
jgi:undecaprenyl-diphosphatase